MPKDEKNPKEFLKKKRKFRKLDGKRKETLRKFIELVKAGKVKGVKLSEDEKTVTYSEDSVLEFCNKAGRFGKRKKKKRR